MQSDIDFLTKKKTDIGRQIDSATELAGLTVKVQRLLKELKIMQRTFIEVPMFTRKWKELGLTDEDLRNLENILLENPKSGDPIQGTGGLRKIRIPIEGRGKRGGDRVIYVDIELKERIYFINVYAKNEKDDLTDDERKAFKAVVNMVAITPKALAKSLNRSGTIAKTSSKDVGKIEGTGSVPAGGPIPLTEPS